MTNTDDLHSSEYSRSMLVILYHAKKYSIAAICADDGKAQLSVKQSACTNAIV